MITGAYKISFEEYLADKMTPEPSLSRSSIIDLLDCPGRAFAKNSRLSKKCDEEIGEEEEETAEKKKFDPGTASHALLLEGLNIMAVIDPQDHIGPKGGVPKGWTTDSMKAARDGARAAGKIPLLPKQARAVLCMAEKAKQKISKCKDFTIKDLQTDGDSELSYFWQEANGVWCRIRPDWISKDRQLILDFKSTKKSVNPSYISGHMGQMEYAVQWAFYRRGVMAIEKTDPRFVFLFQENTAPYFCSWLDLDMQSMDIAEQKVEAAIKKWGECLKSGVWEEYPDYVCSAETKPWDALKWEAQKMALESDGEEE